MRRFAKLLLESDFESSRILSQNCAAVQAKDDWNEVEIVGVKDLDAIKNQASGGIIFIS